MLLNDPSDPVFLDLDRFFQEFGLHLVDLGLRTKGSTTSVNVVLHSSSGLGIDELSRVHKALVPRLEGLLHTDDFSIELGSPGLERNLKYQRELEYYQGRKIRLYLSGAKDWEDGILTAVEAGQVNFQSSSGSKVVPISAIQKAKLHDL